MRNLFILLALCAMQGSALAQSAGAQDALGALTSPLPEERAEAVIALARTGHMADVPALLGRLRDGEPVVRELAEQAIWAVWSRSDDPEVDRLFARGVAEMESQEFAASIATFSRIIELKPDFAEGWNKRATAYFLIGDYRHSLSDCDEVMKRNPYHFGALAGYGQIYLHLEQYEKSLEYFRRALAVNPNLDGVRKLVEALETRRAPGRTI